MKKSKRHEWKLLEWLWCKLFHSHSMLLTETVKSTQPRGLNLQAKILHCRYCGLEQIVVPGYREIGPLLYERKVKCDSRN
jgi:hypothetical protein